MHTISYYSQVVRRAGARVAGRTGAPVAAGTVRGDAHERAAAEELLKATPEPMRTETDRQIDRSV